MIYCPGPRNHIRFKVKAVLDLPNYASKKNYNMLQALIHLMQLLKNDFITLIDEVEKLDIPKLLNVPTNLENLKTKVDNLGDDELKNEQEHT